MNGFKRHPFAIVSAPKRRTAPQTAEKRSAEIAKKIAEFKAKGGKIQKIKSRDNIKPRATGFDSPLATYGCCAD